ncbi:unnamed protein product [Phaeothamnion confervicola]
MDPVKNMLRAVGRGVGRALAHSRPEVSQCLSVRPSSTLNHRFSSSTAPPSHHTWLRRREGERETLQSLSKGSSRVPAAPTGSGGTCSVPLCQWWQCSLGGATGTLPWPISPTQAPMSLLPPRTLAQCPPPAADAPIGWEASSTKKKRVWKMNRHKWKKRRRRNRMRTKKD